MMTSIHSILNRLVLFSALFLVFIPQACKDKKPATAPTAGQKPPVPKVEAFIVRYDTFTETLEVPGSLVANESAMVNPEVSGRLVQLNIQEGKTVSKGTLLAKIFDGDLKAQLNKLQAQLAVQEQTVKRYAELLKINGVSQQEYDLIALQTNNLRADIDIVRTNIQRTEVRAPFTGKLGLKMISPGAYVSPQTTLTTLQQIEGLKLDFNLPEKYTDKIKTGHEVTFITEGSGNVYRARVVASEPSVSEDNRSLTVRALVENRDGAAIPGKFAKVRLTFEPDTKAILIPSQAVIPQARYKQVALMKNGELSFETVTTAVRDSARVQILSGLRTGDTVILTGLMGLKPGGKASISRIVN